MTRFAKDGKRRYEVVDSRCESYGDVKKVDGKASLLQSELKGGVKGVEGGKQLLEGGVRPVPHTST